MLKTIRSIRELFRCQSGNAVLITALGLPAIVGGAGFAVDTAQWYLWKRELQHAVDQAAIAGAYALSQETSEQDYINRAVQEYASNIQITGDFDSDPQVAMADFGDGTLNSVVVSASATRTLPFSNLIMRRGVTISTSAQASFRMGANYSACLISLTDEGTGTSIGGNAEVRANCGLAALSCDEDSIIIDGSATVKTESIAACGTINAEGFEDISSEGIAGLSDAYADLVPPDNDVDREYKCTGKGKNKQASLLPGTYSGLSVSCKTQLASGIYVIDGGTLDLTGNYDVTGNGVMFVLKNGANVKLGGQGNDNQLNLTPMTASDFFNTPYESQASDLEGILVFEDRNNNSQQDHQFNGNSDSLIEGLIYLPDGNLVINGTADVAAQCLQISAYTIDIRGGAFLETLCPTDASTEVGSALADVRLVA